MFVLIGLVAHGRTEHLRRINVGAALGHIFLGQVQRLHVSNRAVVNSIEFVLPALHSVAPECPGGTDEHKQEYNDDRGDSDNQDQKVHGSSGCELENHHGAHLLSWLKGMAARRTT